MELLSVRLVEADEDVALITDDDSVYYFTSFYDYLHMEFGRPDDFSGFPGWRKLVDDTFHRSWCLVTKRFCNPEWCLP